MADSSERLAERMANAEVAFTLVVVERKSLREAAAEIGVSHTTVRELVKAYKRFLADDRITEDREQKRAAFEAMANDLYTKALEVYATAKDRKPLTAVGALNSAIAVLPHLRAVQGLDEPKEVKADVDQDITIKWEE